MICPRVGAQATSRDQVDTLVREARELISAKKYVEARDKLDAAKALIPTDPSVYANLGYLYESQGDKEAALSNYGHLLYLDAGNQYASARIKALFLTGKFPRSFKLSHLRFAPISAVVDDCHFVGPDGKPETGCRLAYTTSPLFPEQMTDNGPPIQSPLPALAGGAGATAQFNRVTYGYIVEPGNDTADLRFMLYYPSPLLSAKQADYSQLAPHLMHMLLRMYWYNRWHLGLKGQDRVVNVWLCDSGPAGAEQLDDNIYLYDAVTPRTALEWTRELAHEYGHYILPQVGKFVEPEPLASGELGERLSLQWLADEAGQVAKAPWPRPEALSVLNNLWVHQELPLQDYIVGKCRKTLDLWQMEGPGSQLAGGVGADGMNFFVGFMLWIDAAHGDAVLRDVLTKAPGTTPADFAFAYKGIAKALADDKQLAIDAGALCLSRSKLTTPPAEGAVRRENVVLAGGDTAAWWVYLPSAAWTLSLQPAPATQLGVSVDDGNLIPCKPGNPANLGQLAEGWHCILVSAPAGPPVTPLNKLLFLKAPEA